MKTLILFLFLFISIIGKAQIINFTDPNFKAYLLSADPVNAFALNITGNPISIDQNFDNEIQISEALSVYELNLANNSIQDVTGINNFTNLNKLYFMGTSVTQIDFSGLLNLTYIYLHNDLVLNQINLTGLVNLTGLDFINTNISTVNLSDLINLTDLYCYNNQLTNIDLTGLTNLQTLYCSNNNITPSLDISNNLLLDTLVCNNNNLIQLFTKNGVDNLKITFGNNPNLEFICANELQINAVQDSLIQYGHINTEVNSYCSFTPGGNYNTIKGNLIFDSNSDGCDGSDPYRLQYQKIRIQGLFTDGADFTDTIGGYKFYTQAGEYAVIPVFENPLAFSIPIPLSTIIFADDNNNISTRDFCITPNGFLSDVEIVFSPIQVARPGFDATYELVYKNKGNQIVSGNFKLGYNDAVLDLVSSDVIPVSNINDTLKWNYTTLLPFETKRIELVFHVNAPTDISPVNIGDTLKFYTAITQQNTDYTPIDNQQQFNQIVVGAFDPNMITCLEGAVIAPIEIGNYVHYGIDFENTGNFVATNIVVVQNIDAAKYDLHSLQVLNSSHDVYTVLNNNTNKVEFVFENIALEDHKHGNILLKYKTLGTLNTGDTINQNADIYFDYNFPIRTNDAESIYKDLYDGIQEKEKDQTIQIYPNPNTGNFIVSAKSPIKLIEIYDVNGRLIITKIVNNKEVNVNISEKEKGIYFVKTTTETGVNLMKIINE